MEKQLKSSGQNNFYHICESCTVVCCREARPPLTERRINIIRDYLLSEKIEFEVKNLFEREEYSFPKETSDKLCIFSDAKTKKCKIHHLKPETCIAGPITFDINIKKGTIEWYLKTEKICQLASYLYRDKNELRKHLKSAKREINNLVKELSKNELLTIIRIDEPETFKIEEDPLDSEVLKKLTSLL